MDIEFDRRLVVYNNSTVLLQAVIQKRQKTSEDRKKKNLLRVKIKQFMYNVLVHCCSCRCHYGWQMGRRGIERWRECDVHHIRGVSMGSHQAKRREKGKYSMGVDRVTIIIAA